MIIVSNGPAESFMPPRPPMLLPYPPRGPPGPDAPPLVEYPPPPPRLMSVMDRDMSPMGPPPMDPPPIDPPIDAPIDPPMGAPMELPIGPAPIELPPMPFPAIEGALPPIMLLPPMLPRPMPDI